MTKHSWNPFKWLRKRRLVIATLTMSRDYMEREMEFYKGCYRASNRHPKMPTPTAGSETDHILELLGEDSGMSISEVSRRANLHRLDASGRLNTLSELGYLSKEMIGTAWIFSLEADLYATDNDNNSGNKGDNI